MRCGLVTADGMAHFLSVFPQQLHQDDDGLRAAVLMNIDSGTRPGLPRTENHEAMVGGCRRAVRLV
jgi:hypothetical protein